MMQLSEKKELFIFGNGGHASVLSNIVDLSETHKTSDYIDKKNEGSFLSTVKPGTACLLAIGENYLRKKLWQRLLEYDLSFPSFVHPSAVVAQNVEISEGAVVMAGSIINPRSSIGAFSVINTGAIIEHDCRCEQFVSVAPGAVVCGGVTIDEGSYIGAGSVVTHGRKIGSWSVVGAGAVAVSDIPAHVTAYGCPARVVGARDAEDKVL